MSPPAPFWTEKSQKKRSSHALTKRGWSSPAHDLVARFRGNWNLPWVMQRYMRSALSGTTPRKGLNATAALFDMGRGKARVHSRPFVLRIEPTNVCNLRCPRCSCGINTDPRPKGYMSLNDFRLTLEQTSGYAIIIRLDGNGEPTLHPQIFEMIEMATSFGCSVSISTNLNTRACAEIDRFIDCGLSRLIVPVDGITQASHQKYRVGGSLSLTEQCLTELMARRKRRGSRKPLVEVQLLDWGYNHDEIPEVRRKAVEWGADKFQAISPDWAVTHAQADPKKPRRCFWLWSVLTVDWALNYRSCTNAWSMPWPRLNLKDIPPDQFWNHEVMVAARRYNVDKSPDRIAADPGCNCNNCCDMLVVDRPPGYVCL